MALLLASDVLAECGQSVGAADYHLCAPVGWSVETNDRNDSINICKTDGGNCMKNKDNHPYPGVVALSIVPSDRGYGIYESPEYLARKARVTGLPLPVIKDVKRSHPGDGPEPQCWVARTLLYGDLWEDIYSLTVGGRRFRVWVTYNNEPANIEPFREAVVQILSSITPDADGARPNKGR